MMLCEMFSWETVRYALFYVIQTEERCLKVGHCCSRCACAQTSNLPESFLWTSPPCYALPSSTLDWFCSCQRTSRQSSRRLFLLHIFCIGRHLLVHLRVTL